LETIWFESCEPDPAQPWCLTSTADDSKHRSWRSGDTQYVRLWDMRDVREVAYGQFFPEGHRSKPQFSPDGALIAMRENGLKIPIFKIVSIEP
jgi:hypothetical protein